MKYKEGIITFIIIVIVLVITIILLTSKTEKYDAVGSIKGCMYTPLDRLNYKSYKDGEKWKKQIIVSGKAEDFSMYIAGVFQDEADAHIFLNYVKSIENCQNDQQCKLPTAMSDEDTQICENNKCFMGYKRNDIKGSNLKSQDFKILYTESMIIDFALVYKTFQSTSDLVVCLLADLSWEDQIALGVLVVAGVAALTAVGVGLALASPYLLGLYVALEGMYNAGVALWCTMKCIGEAVSTGVCESLCCSIDDCCGCCSAPCCYGDCCELEFGLKVGELILDILSSGANAFIESLDLPSITEIAQFLTISSGDSCANKFYVNDCDAMFGITDKSIDNYQKWCNRITTDWKMQYRSVQFKKQFTTLDDIKPRIYARILNAIRNRQPLGNNNLQNPLRMTNEELSNSLTDSLISGVTDEEFYFLWGPYTIPNDLLSGCRELFAKIGQQRIFSLFNQEEDPTKRPRILCQGMYIKDDGHGAKEIHPMESLLWAWIEQEGTGNRFNNDRHSSFNNDTFQPTNKEVKMVSDPTNILSIDYPLKTITWRVTVNSNSNYHKHARCDWYKKQYTELLDQENKEVYHVIWYLSLPKECYNPNFKGKIKILRRPIALFNQGAQLVGRNLGCCREPDIMPTPEIYYSHAVRKVKETPKLADKDYQFNQNIIDEFELNQLPIDPKDGKRKFKIEYQIDRLDNFGARMTTDYRFIITPKSTKIPAKIITNTTSQSIKLTPDAKQLIEVPNVVLNTYRKRFQGYKTVPYPDTQKFSFDISRQFLKDKPNGKFFTVKEPEINFKTDSIEFEYILKDGNKSVKVDQNSLKKQELDIIKNSIQKISNIRNDIPRKLKIIPDKKQKLQKDKTTDKNSKTNILSGKEKIATKEFFNILITIWQKKLQKTTTIELSNIGYKNQHLFKCGLSITLAIALRLLPEKKIQINELYNKLITIPIVPKSVSDNTKNTNTKNTKNTK
jgi:hypothetical protein